MKVSKVSVKNGKSDEVKNSWKRNVEIKEIVAKRFEDEIDNDIMNEEDFQDLYQAQAHIFSDGYINAFNVGSIVG
jgi:hypothetical protein